MTRTVVPRPRRIGRTPSHPARRSRNGHHPDCPYPRTNAETCSICAGIRKAAPDGDPQPAEPPTLRLVTACPTCYAPVEPSRTCTSSRHPKDAP